MAEINSVSSNATTQVAQIIGADAQNASIAQGSNVIPLRHRGIHAHHRRHEHQCHYPPTNVPPPTKPEDQTSLINQMNEKFQKMMEYMTEVINKLLATINASTQSASAATTTASTGAGAATTATTPQQPTSYVDPETETGTADDTIMGQSTQSSSDSTETVENTSPEVKESTNPVSLQPLKNMSGFLWKPVSDKDGNLAVLLPKHLTGRVKSVEIQDKNGKVIGRGKTSGVGNGDREHFRFNKKGSQYPAGCKVVITLESGQKRSVEIASPSKRLEKK